MIKDLLNFLNLLDFKIKSLLILLVISMLIGSVLETFGIALLIPLLQNIFDNQFSFNFIFFKNTFFEKLQVSTLITIFFSLLFLKNLFLIAILYYQQYFSWNLGKFTSDKLFFSYLNKNVQYLNDLSTSLIIRNIITESNGIIGIAISVTTIIREALIIVFILSFLILLNSKIVLFFFFPIIIFFIIFYIPTKTLIKKYSLQRQKFDGQKIKIINDFISSIIETKLINLKKYFFMKFSETNSNYAYSGRNMKFFAMSTTYVFELTISLLIILILIFYNSSIFFNKSTIYISISYASIYGLAIFRILPSVNRILLSINDINVNSPSLRIVKKEIDNEKDHSDIESLSKIKIKRNIIFKKINFIYKNKKILKNANIELKVGKITGIVGSSGSGKTTLVKIISGLLTNYEGEIYIDNNLIKDNNLLRKHTFLVQQISNVIDENLYENITFETDFQKNNKKFQNSIINTNLIDLYRDIKDSKLGSSGNTLSGGEKQRISLARMFYYLKDIIIFDEATNSLDNDNEKLIIKNLTKLKKNRIVIFISHDQRKVKDICDFIYKIQNQKIVRKK